MVAVKGFWRRFFRFGCAVASLSSRNGSWPFRNKVYGFHSKDQQLQRSMGMQDLDHPTRIEDWKCVIRNPYDYPWIIHLIKMNDSPQKKSPNIHWCAPFIVQDVETNSTCHVNIWVIAAGLKIQLGHHKYGGVKIKWVNLPWIDSLVVCMGMIPGIQAAISKSILRMVNLGVH